MNRPATSQQFLQATSDAVCQCGGIAKYPYRVCQPCRDYWRAVPILDINTLDPLNVGHARNDADFDRKRDVDERGLVERDARREENPRQGGNRGVD